MRTEKLVSLSLLCAAALVLGFFESLLPLSVGGVKIGLANIVTMLVFLRYTPKETLFFGLFRSFLTAVLFGGISSFFYSGTGTLFCISVMTFLRKIGKNYFSPIGISVAGAYFFNLGQTICAACFTKSIYVFSFFPFYGVVSVVGGICTGMLANILFTKYKRK